MSDDSTKAPILTVLGSNSAFVSAVYLVVLLPWAFLYFHDFISSHWTSIKTTFRNGLIHIFAVFIPMPVLILYIISQARLEQPDLQEMYAAITALVLSIYHLARTVWGLRQLLQFRNWARRTAVTFTRANYPCHLRGPDAPAQTLSDVKRRSSSSIRPSTLLQQRIQPNSPSSFTPLPAAVTTPIANAHRRLRNRLRSGVASFISPATRSQDAHQLPLTLSMPPHTSVSCSQTPTCTIHPRDTPAQAITDAATTTTTTTTTAAHNSANTRRNGLHHQHKPHSFIDHDAINREVDKMLVNSSIIDNEFIGSSAPRVSPIHMRPRRPTETFVRWSVCFLAQFGTSWLRDSNTHRFDPATWSGRRYTLAAEVWATAALRMDTDCLISPPRSRRSPPHETEPVSFLPPRLWRRLLPNVNDQVFSKRSLLERCYRSGDGFPYDCPILSDSIEFSDDFGHTTPPVVSAGVYRSLIRDTLGQLPAHLYDVVDGLLPEQLEWFAIFIWITEWSGCTPEKGDDTNSPNASPLPHQQFPSSSPRTPRYRTSNVGRWTVLAPNHAPVLTLQDQLGMDSDVTLDKCGFPFIQQGYGRGLWGNRSVLQVSARIDNWLSLRIGHQFVSLLKHHPTIGAETATSDAAPDRPATASGAGGNEAQLRGKLGAANFVIDTTDEEEERQTARDSKADKDNDNGRRRSSDDSERIFRYHRDLELTRLRYQLSRTRPQLNHLDQGISFMGCVMETLRSFLAEHFPNDRPMTRGSDPWVPPVPTTDVVTLPVSYQLAECLVDLDVEDVGDVFDSTVRERLLWECQNGVVHSMEERYNQIRREAGAQDRGPQHLAQAIMLAILAFPGLHVTRFPSREANFSLRVGDDTRPSRFCIEVPAGPQPVSIQVHASAQRRRMNLILCDNGVMGRVFRWQDWRDAFHGRLYGKALWQRTHYMRVLRVSRTIGAIDRGFTEVPVGENRKIPLWEGWRPFRARIRKFELEHSSLIIFDGEMPSDSFRTPGASMESLEEERVPEGRVTTEGEDDRDGQRRSTGSTAESGQLPARLPAVAAGAGGVTSSVEAYSLASAAALSDASTHVDAALCLNLSLISKDERRKMSDSQSDDDAGPLGPSSPHRLTPQSSQGSIQPVSVHGSAGGGTVSMHFIQGGGEENIMQRVNRQDPKAMVIAANYMLKGLRPFVKDRQKALLLLERAIVIERDVNVAKLFVENVVSRKPRVEEEIDRALTVVEGLWRDVPTRRRENGGELGEQNRQWVKTLVHTHGLVINVRRRANLMRDLADQIAEWGSSDKDRERAIRLYESAVIADCDVWAMAGLALLFVGKDLAFARRLYERSTHVTQDEGGMMGIVVARHVDGLARDGDDRARVLLGWVV